MPEDKVLVITPRNLGFSILNPDRDVVVHLELDPERTGFQIPVMIRMTPTEARKISAVLSKKADEAESGLSRA